MAIKQNKFKVDVLDVGARAGIESILPNWIPKKNLRSYAEYFRFVGIEPDPGEADRLEKKGGYEKVHKLALSDVHGEKTLYITRQPDKSSILEPDLEIIKNWYTGDLTAYEVVQKIAVQTTTIDKLNDADAVDFDWIKVDTQGSEYEVLQGALNSLKEVTVILTELSTAKQYINQKTTVDFIAAINDLGFDILLVNYKPIMSCENDIVFVRRLNTITTLKQVFSLACCFSIFNLDAQKKFLLDEFAPRIISEQEIAKIRELVDSAEKRYFANENASAKLTLLEKIKAAFF